MAGATVQATQLAFGVFVVVHTHLEGTAGSREAGRADTSLVGQYRAGATVGAKLSAVRVVFFGTKDGGRILTKLARVVDLVRVSRGAVAKVLLLSGLWSERKGF